MPYVTWQEFTSGGRPQGGTIREDLQDFVANVSPQETPLISGLTQKGVKSAFVEWLSDSLAARGHNAVAEGIAYTEQSLTMPTRTFNHVQSFYKSGSVSDTERQVDHAGFDDPFTYQEMKRFLELRNDMEHALHRGSAATGATNAARQMNGMLNVLSTNMTSSSGTTLTETVFNDILELVYQNGSVQPSEVYCNSRIKRTISGYNTKTTFNIDAKDKRQILATDFYGSDFGDLRIYLARDQLRSATAAAYGNSWIVIDPKYFMTGWLQTVRRETLARDGLRDRFQMSAKATLIHKTEAAGGGMTGVVANV